MSFYFLHPPFPLVLWIINTVYALFLFGTAAVIKGFEMEEEHELIVACIISGTLFSVLGVASFSILWLVNWRPWRIYR